VVAVDEGPPVAERWSALAMGQVIDEETGRPAAVPLIGRADHLGVTVTAAGDGNFCLVARPWLACPPLRAASYSFTATLEATGYLPVDVAVVVPSRQRSLIAPAPALGGDVITLDNVAALRPGQLLAIGPANSEERARIRHLGPGPQQVTLTGRLGLPHALGDHVVADDWTPVTLGTVGMRRPPVVVRGRAVRRDAATNTVTPVPLATVRLVDFWTTLAALRAALPGAMTDPNPATRAFLLSISPGLVATRDAASSQVSRQNLLPTAGSERFLVASVAAGASAIRVSDRQALASGAVLRLDADDGDIAESITVTGVRGLGAPNQEGELTLALPLRASHRSGARLHLVVPQPAAAGVAFRRDVRALDRALFVADATTLPDDIDVRLTGGATAAERQHAHHIEAITDAAGFFALPPVHRVAALKLRATAPPLSPIEITYHPEYGPLENWVEVVFA
jgi:hypothetical protein